MKNKIVWTIFALSIALMMVASSVMGYSTQKGEEGVSEVRGKGVISFVDPPFIEVTGASETLRDDAGSSALRAGTSFIEEEAGIIKYTDGEQKIVIQELKSGNYSYVQSEMRIMSSSITYHKNFTMLIGEKKCSFTHNSCPEPLFPGSVTCYAQWNTDGRPNFIDFSSSFSTYCIEISKDAKPGTYEFQVGYFDFFVSPPVPLRGSLSSDHNINITVIISECHNCSILTGVVTDLRGNPIYNAEIHLAKEDYGGIDYHTDLSGFYSTGPLRNGTYAVSVSPPSGVNSFDKVITANITQNTTLNITLQCGGILTGKVMDMNGTPVYNAKVSVSGLTSSYDYTDINGTYSIIRLKNGTYSVRITPPSGTNLLEQTTNVTVTVCRTTYLNSTLQFGGILAGRVTYENGTGICDVLVRASGPESVSEYTNTTGYYRIIGLLAGDYTVQASAPSGTNLVSNSTEASVMLGETTVMDFVLHPRENYP